MAVATVWTAIALSFTTNYPVGFFVGTSAALLYALGRGWAALRRRSGGAALRARHIDDARHPPERHTILT